MKSIIPWVCLVAAVNSNALMAENGLEAYRQGYYFQASRAFTGQIHDAAADYYLGMMYLYGYGELRKTATALDYFNKAADKNFTPAQVLLGSYYLDKNNPEKAFYWYNKASAQDATAKLYCAAAYLYGFGVKKNEDIARRYFIDMARLGNSQAQLALAQQFLQGKSLRDKKMGLIWLTKAADQHNTDALFQLARIYIDGKLVTKDLAVAENLISRAAKNNANQALLEMANLKLAANETSQAITWYTKAASEPNGEAEFRLASLYLTKNSSVFNVETGFQWAVKSAEKGSYEGQQLLASLYKTGTGTAKSELLAADWDKKANASLLSKQQPKALTALVSQWLTAGQSTNFANSPYQLSGIFTDWSNKNALKENIYNAPPHQPALSRQEVFTPKFTLQSPADVPMSDYFNVLANSLMSQQQEHVWNFPHYPLNRQFAAINRDESFVLKHDTDVNLLIEDKTLSNENTVQPFNYFEELTTGWQTKAHYQVALTELYGEAILGNPDALFEIGQLYQYGIGVSKNIDQALIYLQLAAAQQDIRAEYDLGMIFLQGQTNPRDYQKGLEWMTDAAFKGNAYAQYVLANIYDKGLADADKTVLVEPNHEQAIAMYYLSAANNYSQSLFYLAEMLVREKPTNLSVAALQEKNKLILRLYKNAAKKGMVEAQLPLAFYYAMDKNVRHQAEAFKIAKAAAENGDSNAAVLLGLMLERGIAVKQDSVEALYWFRKAENNPISQFALGTYYGLGQGVNKDIQQAEQLLQQSANAGFSYSLLNLAILHQQRGQSFLPELDKALTEGNSTAGILLADYFLQQADDPNNIEKARSIYTSFAEKGDKDAQLKLGFLYAQGLLGKRDNDFALKWYTSAATQGQPTAQYLLGQFYQDGNASMVPDYNQAKKWFLAAKTQYVPAYVALGFLYDTVDNNYQLAEENYLQAAKISDPIGQYNLGLIYEYGKGVPVDYSKAKDWYEKAATQNYPAAMAQLGSLYFKEQSTNGSEQQALSWYTKAANLGDVSALYEMGLLSETGVITKLDYPAAIRYYQQASELGNEKAKAALARMYLYGIGTEKNVEMAASLYKQLAEHQNAYAEYQLGLIHLNGYLGASDAEAAKNWLTRAANNGHVQAFKLVQRISAQKQLNLSYIEPLVIDTKAPQIAAQSADMMYMDALNEWNRGDENSSRQILKELITQHPQFNRAKAAYMQINQQPDVANDSKS